ncbi:MAG: MBOAT family O-acyltransferase [Phycisphaerae bacterium]
MSFNSIHFLLFFPVVLAVYWSLRRNAFARLIFLLIASYYFYMSWNVVYAGLILGSSALDFVVGLKIYSAANRRRRRAWLIVSLTGNLGVLFVFKYYNFFAESIVEALRALGWNIDLALHSLLLPVGISFYTFQTLSYTIDVYRGKLEPTRNFLNFALFVSFFPQLVAGPIVRAAHFLPQLERGPRFDDREAQQGLMQIMVGLFKKICVADLLGATVVDAAYAHPSSAGSTTLLIAMYAYAVQMYCDFSGYSDIAIGAARMLGFHLPINFDRPLLATSISNFWRRWHISLSSWLRDYLYIPLGGGRCGAWKTARNLATVMILCGLWHGAAWGYVVFGFLHFVMLAAGRLVRTATGIDPDRPDQKATSRALRIWLTVSAFALSLVFFRARDISTAKTYLATLLSATPEAPHLTPLAYAVLALAFVVVIAPRNCIDWLPRAYVRLPSLGQAGLVTASLLLFATVGGSTTSFIYFQF